MWFKLSLLLFLIFCSCNVSSKNLRKSLNQKFDGYGSMADSVYPNAAPDVKFPDYNGYGGEVRGKQHHVLIDDSLNLNSHIGKHNGHKFDGSNFDKQHKDVLAEIQHNGYSGYKEETPAKRKQLNNDSNDDKYGEQKHGRFRRSAKDRAEAIGGFFLWLLIIGGIVLCCCLPGIILCVILMRR
uniref:Uncharacterized protein n=1 Tax=Panagrolaimus davidi TaxID=227884 RepID=A0A914PFK7_9BILA